MEAGLEVKLIENQRSFRVQSVGRDLLFMSSSVQSANKKIYHGPTLTHYGSLADMTAGLHVRGKKDSSPAGSKTG